MVQSAFQAAQLEILMLPRSVSTGLLAEGLSVAPLLALGDSSLSFVIKLKEKLLLAVLPTR